MPTPRPRGLPPRSLAEVAARLSDPQVDGAAANWGELLVRGVSLDSRCVQPGDLYAALPGAHTHGAEHAAAAVAAGAVAVLSDQPTPVEVPTLVVEHPREELGELAAWLYGDPSTQMTVIGVTGTNGKTTTAYLLEAALAASGAVTGLLGTVETRVAGAVLPSVRTTPEAPELQALLALMLERGVTAAAMEVSSHALSLGRVDGLHTRAAIFTNLSQDHLDFHDSMQSYFAAKALLFRPGRAETGVVNIDDPWGQRLVELLRIPLVTFSAAGDQTADWQLTQIAASGAGTQALAHGPAGERVELRVLLPGLFNLTNGLAALAALVATGMSAEQAAAGIASCTLVPGRMQPVAAGQPFLALVDFAHTPEAVRALLATLRPITTGQLVVVLGCGGDRDAAKRPLMAAAAVAAADQVVFTSDNPRSESPAAIVADMTAGLAPGVGRWSVELDRGAAIAMAVAQLGPGDTVVVAGKGHETGQEIAGVITDFDDRVELRRAIERAAGGA